MKSLFLSLVVAGGLLTTTLPVTASEQGFMRPLQIAIDDGTDDGVVFVELDERDAVYGSPRATWQARAAQRGVDAAVAVDSLHARSAKRGERCSLRQARLATLSSNPAREQNSDRITIISAHTIDDATRASLRSLLSGAGHDGGVVFLERKNPTHAMSGTEDAM